jgi:hypothetical protein
VIWRQLGALSDGIGGGAGGFARSCPSARLRQQARQIQGDFQGDGRRIRPNRPQVPGDFCRRNPGAPSEALAARTQA